MQSRDSQTNETDRMAIVAAACAGAIWVYDQFKIQNGINLIMIICALFIISGLMYLMAVGHTLTTGKQKARKKGILHKAKEILYSFTIKYFWYISFYILYILVASAINTPYTTANSITTTAAAIIGITMIIFLFKKPREMLTRIATKLKLSPKTHRQKHN